MKIKEGMNILCAAFVVCAVCGALYLGNFFASREAASWRSAMEKAPSMAEEHFKKKWSSYTVDDGKPIAWYGSDSDVLYVSSSGLQCIGDCWVNLWAKTSSGRYFVLKYAVVSNENAFVFPEKNFEVISRESLLKVLVRDGKIDLIKRLGFEVSPA